MAGRMVSTRDVASAWDKSEDAVWRLKKNPKVRWIREFDSRGGRGTLYFDPESVVEVWGPPPYPLPAPEPTELEPLDTLEPVRIVSTALSSTGEATIPDLRQADPDDLALWQRLEELRQQIRNVSRGRRKELVEAFAEAEQTSIHNVYRWLRLPASQFFKIRRRDAGSSHLPPELRDAVTSLWLHHPKASAWTIHRWLQVANPDILIYRRGNYERRLSVRGVRDVRRRLEANPVTRAALMNEDQRREFLRTWSGAVIATHPNDLWQMDMTRCDTFVWGYARAKDTEPSAFRLRIHDCIDHYTGAIPALVFSREESRRPTTRLLILGLFPKPDGWNIFGKPRRIYHDNGSAYLAEATQRGLATLGIEVSTSQAWVSHTRGKVENFHKLFHAWERTLPGYAGEDASQRNDWELARLIENTRRWAATGYAPEADPGRGNRLLLEEEYKREALNWLQNDYHARILPGGLTRAELFMREVPPETQMQFKLRDLFEIFADSEERTVSGNGEVRWRNTRYTLPDGTLMLYQGRKVVVTEYEHPLTGEPIVNIYLPQPSGNLLELGTAVPAPEDALSQQAFEQRKANRERVKELFAKADEFRRDYLNPAWRQDAILAKGRPANEPIVLEMRGPKAELKRESPAEAAVRERAALLEKAKDDPILRAILTLSNPTASVAAEAEEN